MLRIVPMELEEANVVVAAWHRHHKPVVGHRFSLGCVDHDGIVRGVCIVGRPVARLAGDPSSVAEVARLCTDGSKNACSILYAASARVCREIGFERVQTYILEEETGISLLAAGWEYVGVRGGGQWKHTDGKPRRSDQPIGAKGLWQKRLGRPRGELHFPRPINSSQASLFEN